jgi:carbonic anhydrase
VKAIQPAVAQVKGRPGDLLENAIAENAREVAAKLKASSLLAERVRSGQLKIVSAVYDLKTGRVTPLK